MRSIRPVILSALCVYSAAAQTNTINTYAGTPTQAAGFGGDTGPATSALLNTPTGVAVDSSGNLYIADSENSRIRVVYTDGTIGTFAGNGASFYGGDGNPALAASFIAPSAVAVDSSGNVYIADPQASVIRKVSGGIISTVAGTGTAGYTGDNGPAVSASLNFPSGVAVDASGNLYIADTSNHRIRKVSAGVITTVAGNGVPAYSGDGLAATLGSLFFPQGVAIDASGNIYIADTQNNRIRKVTAGTITTIAGNGTTGYAGDLGPATAANINAPRGIAVDGIGNIYIGDTGNNVVRKVSNSVISTVAGNGTAGYSGDGGPAISAQLNYPVGVVVDPTGGYTYIADSNNDAIRVITNTNTSGVIPHFAAGGSYVTGLYVINLSATSALPFTISFYNDAGTGITVPVSGGSSTATTSGNSFTDTIPALGMSYYEAGTLSAATLLSGSAVIQSSPSIVVQGLFRHQGAAVTPYEAGIPASLGAPEIEIPFDDTIYTPTNTQIYTGIAFANLDGTNTANISCVARSSGGAVIAGAVTIPALNPLGHYAGYQFPALAGQRGTLDCTSNTRIAAIALRAIGTDAISSLPVILK